MKHISKFFTEVRLELSRVEWPSYDDFMGSMIIVLLTVVIFSLFFGVVDLMISLVAKKIFMISSW